MEMIIIKIGCVLGALIFIAGWLIERYFDKKHASRSIGPGEIVRSITTGEAIFRPRRSKKLKRAYNTDFKGPLDIATTCCSNTFINKDQFLDPKQYCFIGGIAK